MFTDCGHKQSTVKYNKNATVTGCDFFRHKESAYMHAKYWSVSELDIDNVKIIAIYGNIFTKPKMSSIFKYFNRTLYTSYNFRKKSCPPNLSFSLLSLLRN